MRSDKVKTSQDLLDEVKALKEGFKEQTADMNFKDKEVVLQREVERLLVKGFEHLLRAVKDQQTFNTKQSEENVKYLENQVAALKKELQEN